MFKQEKGITLVALVITIIVLLILAGVSISLVMGDNGVLSQANNAVNSTELASVKDEISMAMTTVQTNYYATYGNTTGRSSIIAELVNHDKLKKEFPNATGVVVKVESATKATIYYKHKSGNFYEATLAPTTESVAVSEVKASSITALPAAVAFNASTSTGTVVLAP